LNRVARAFVLAPSLFFSGGDMDFQVHDDTYFLSLAEDERRWEFFVSTPTGAREIPVYVDSPLEERVIVVQSDEHRQPN
jgi:hypothetical protein